MKTVASHSTYATTRSGETRYGPRQRVRSPRGFPLIELLIVVAISLILIAALAQIFELLGTGIDEGRSVIEMNGQMRAACLRLQSDLDGVTVPTLPWTTTQVAEGYIEVTEGLGRDSGPAATDTIAGDIDDVLMFTARARGTPFVGQIQGSIVSGPDGLYVNPAGGTTVIESTVAEIIWWVDRDGEGNVNVYRRVFLVRPDLNIAGMATPNFRHNNDLSVRQVGSIFVANSLSDLTRRESRFAHNPANFPHLLDATIRNPAVSSPWILNDQRLGDDVMLGRVSAFDVKVYDPTAPIRSDGNVALVPGDPGWVSAGTILGLGAYVDLNYANSTISTFSGPPHVKSQLATLAVYDTWSSNYEQDGLDQDGDGLIDEGTNGLDDPPQTGGVDDPAERETSPPYPVPLRAVQVAIRLFEPDSGAVRQETVTANFARE